MFPDAVIETRSLVRLTPDEINDIRAGLRVGLESVFGSDNYVYYVDNYGNPIPWTGFSGYANNLTGMPYLTCPLHNEETIMNIPTEPEYSFGDGSGNIIYPDDDNSFDFGGNYGDSNGGTGDISGDYSGNGDVFF